MSLCAVLGPALTGAACPGWHRTRRPRPTKSTPSTTRPCRESWPRPRPSWPAAAHTRSTWAAPTWPAPALDAGAPPGRRLPPDAPPPPAGTPRARWGPQAHRIRIFLVEPSARRQAVAPSSAQ